METYRYEQKIVVMAINYTDAKRQIEARISGPLNFFRLEILAPDGRYYQA